MRSAVLAMMMLGVSGNAFAVTPVDPVLGNSPAGITELKLKEETNAVDPVLGRSPVATAVKPIERPTQNDSPSPPPPVVVYPQPDHGHGHGHGGKKVEIINQYIYTAPTQNTNISHSTVSYGISNTNFNDSAVVDGTKYMLLKRWRGTCFDRNCMLSSGYLESNPNKGVIVLMNPNLSNGPLVFFPSSETGPLIITEDNSLNNLLVIESQRGTYLGTSTKGGEKFVFNLAKGEWKF